MQFKHVCLEGLAYTLPPEIVGSSQLEAALAPVYQRLRLPEGRLELMTGIRERRFWPRDTMPSQYSAISVRKALEISDFPPERMGALIHASVCRDHLEPATSCIVHRLAELPDDCLLYDVSNACLGFLNGMVQIAGMIELGHIQAGVVVATESSRALVETTIANLNADESLTRSEIKYALASLTIGSGSVAAVLAHEDISRTRNRLLGGMALCDTSNNHLCRSGRDEAAEGMQPLMRTDSETLMHTGVALGERGFAGFLQELGWQRDSIDRTVCHQVGLGHRKLMLQSLGLQPENDFTTVETLGNTGSVALPITLAHAAEAGFVQPQQNVALLGIGSGINTLMLGVQWQRSLIAQAELAAEPLAELQS